MVIIFFYIPGIPTKEDITIKGLEDLLDSGIVVEVVCTVNPIKPKAYDMFWKFDNQRINSTMYTSVNGDGITLTQYIVLYYK